MMNKITIPIILAVTVMVAGMFAFMPVEQASTVHSSSLIQSQGASGVITSIASDTITSTFAGAGGGTETIFHWVVFESTQPYKLVDIEVQGTLASELNDSSDRIRLLSVQAFQAEYTTTSTNVNLAINNGQDNVDTNLCNFCGLDAVDGNDRFDTFTISFAERQVSNNQDFDGLHFGPNTKIFVELQFRETGDDAFDADAIVTFYVSGPTVADLTVTVFENESDI